MSMIDRIEPGPHGTRLRDLGTVVSVVPPRRAANGEWIGPFVDRQPLGMGGHRLIDRVEMEPAAPPAGAEDLGLHHREWYRATVICWTRSSNDAPQQVVEWSELITTWSGE